MSQPSVINDRLLVMWEMQKELNKRVGLDSDLMQKASEVIGSAEINDTLGNLHVALGQELAEFRDSIHWKWWKAGSSDHQNAKVEVVDMFHFLMSMAQVLGMSAEDFYQGYLLKNKVNHSRQDGDYATNPNAVGGESDCKHLFQTRVTQPELTLPTCE